MEKTKRLLVPGALLFLVLQGDLLADDAIGSSPQVNLRTESHSVLNGNRLFFTIAERDAVNDSSERQESRDIPDIHSAKKQEKITTPVGKIKKSRQKLAMVDVYAISYQARIASKDGVRIIVNGSPCQSVHREIGISQSGLIIQCHALSENRLKLTLLGDGLRLQVSDGARQLGVLLPGESL